MILLQAIYFCTYWTFLCNITDISTIAHRRLYSLLKGALLSRFELTLMTQSAFSVRLHLPFDILPVVTMVNGATTRVSTGVFGAASTHWFTLYLYSSNTRFENTAFQFWLFFFPLWPLALVGFSVRHAYGCQRLSCFCWWTAWTEKGVMLLWMNALPLVIPAFHFSGFAHRSCTFVNLVLRRCRCIKACFWFYRNLMWKCPMRSTATRVQSSVSCIFLM